MTAENFLATAFICSVASAGSAIADEGRWVTCRVYEECTNLTDCRAFERLSEKEYRFLQLSQSGEEPIVYVEDEDEYVDELYRVSRSFNGDSLTWANSNGVNSIVFYTNPGTVTDRFVWTIIGVRGDIVADRETPITLRFGYCSRHKL